MTGGHGAWMTNAGFGWACSHCKRLRPSSPADNLSPFVTIHRCTPPADPVRPRQAGADQDPRCLHPQV